MSVVINRVFAGEIFSRKVEKGVGFYSDAAPANGVEIRDGDSGILIRADDLRLIVELLDDNATENVEALEFDFWRQEEVDG